MQIYIIYLQYNFSFRVYYWISYYPIMQLYIFIILYNLNAIKKDVHTFSSNQNLQDDTSIRQSSNSERRRFRAYLMIIRSA